MATISEALNASDSFGGFSPSVYTLTIGEAVTALDSVSTSLSGLRGFVTATITIEPMITGAATTEPTITGTITVS
jgi:ABC-type glucose/galactose transport system permease subunit